MTRCHTFCHRPEPGWASCSKPTSSSLVNSRTKLRSEASSQRLHRNTERNLISRACYSIFVVILMNEIIDYTYTQEHGCTWVGFSSSSRRRNKSHTNITCHISPAEHEPRRVGWSIWVVGTAILISCGLSLWFSVANLFANVGVT